MGFNTKNLLYIFVGIVLLGFSLHMAEVYIYTGNLEKLHDEMENSSSGIELCLLLQNDLLKLKSELARLAGMSGNNAYEHITENMELILNRMESLIDVIETGGQFPVSLSLNIVAEEDIIDVILYVPERDSEYNVEILVLRTFIHKIREYIDQLNKLQLQRPEFSGKDAERFYRYNSELTAFMSNIDTLFIRSEEHVNKLYFDSISANRIVSERMAQQESRFVYANYLVFFIILVFVTSLGAVIVRRVVRISLSLEKEEEKFRTFADFTYDWEYWLGTDGSYIYISPSVRRITGYGDEEFYRNKDLLDKLIHPDDLEGYNEHSRFRLDHVAEEQPFNFRVITREGKLIWINHVCRIVYGKNGEMLGIRGSNRDITAEKNMKDLLGRITKANNKLKQSEAALLKSNEEKLVLMRESHHRIKNSLSIISALLTMQIPEMESSKDAQILEESGARIETLANLHSFLYRDDLEYINTESYLNEIIDSLVESYNIDTSAVMISRDFEPFKLASKAAASCGLIVNELFTNAFKYGVKTGKSRGIRISISLSGSNAELRVFNDGEFAADEASLKSDSSFGLTMVNVLTDQLGGTIDLVMELGTEFIITFPLEQEERA